MYALVNTQGFGLCFSTSRAFTNRSPIVRQTLQVLVPPTPANLIPLTQSFFSPRLWTDTVRMFASPAHASSTGDAVTDLVDEPLSPMDVDQELWAVLDMCSDDELEALYNILHATSPFSPVLKSLVVEHDEPALVAQRGRRAVMHRLESHFRFLAAGSVHLLRGARPSYREILLNVREKLDVRCSRNLSTYDLESEIFLHLLNHCEEAVAGPEQPLPGIDPARAASFASGVAVVDVATGSGSARSSTSASTSGPVSTSTAPSSGATAPSSSASPNWTERLTAPLRLGLKDLAPTIVNLAGVVTVTQVGRQASQQLATRLVCSHLRYQAALRAAAGGMGLAAKGGGAMAAGLGKTAVLEAAQHSLTAATARYSALRGALSFMGPLMWGWLAVDLALKAIGPDYARVVRAVFLLSQVRLVRTHGFVSSEMEAISHQSAHNHNYDDLDDYQDPGAAFL